MTRSSRNAGWSEGDTSVKDTPSLKDLEQKSSNNSSSIVSLLITCCNYNILDAVLLDKEIVEINFICSFYLTGRLNI